MVTLDRPRRTMIIEESHARTHPGPGRVRRRAHLRRHPGRRARGWHGPGVLGPFGAAAAVGRLRGFDADTMARAFGLAGSQAAGTYAAWGTPTVKFHQCRGALSGLIAALLAEQKFVATREFLTAKDGGLFNAYADGGKPELATADLGTRWELEQIALRLW